MLEQLFGSKTRVKLLRIFLNNNEPFYLRQLARKLKVQLNSIRREIANLEDIGLIKAVDAESPENIALSKSGKKGDNQNLKKFYLVDQNFILYDELRALLIKSQLLLERDFIQKIEKAGNIKYLALCGFFVGVEDSPTDLLLVGNINRDKLKRIISDFEKELHHNVNYTVMSPLEFKYRADITDRFLYSILEGKKILIVDKLAQHD